MFLKLFLNNDLRGSVASVPWRGARARYDVWAQVRRLGAGATSAALTALIDVTRHDAPMRAELLQSGTTH